MREDHRPLAIHRVGLRPELLDHRFELMLRMLKLTPREPHGPVDDPRVDIVRSLVGGRVTVPQGCVEVAKQDRRPRPFNLVMSTRARSLQPNLAGRCPSPQQRFSPRKVLCRLCRLCREVGLCSSPVQSIQQAHRSISTELIA